MEVHEKPEYVIRVNLVRVQDSNMLFGQYSFGVYILSLARQLSVEEYSRKVKREVVLDSCRNYFVSIAFHQVLFKSVYIMKTASLLC